MIGKLSRSLLASLYLLVACASAYGGLSLTTIVEAEAGQKRGSLVGAVVKEGAEFAAKKAAAKAVQKGAKAAAGKAVDVGKRKAAEKIADGTAKKAVTEGLQKLATKGVDKACAVCPKWRLPVNNGRWLGEKGNSGWVSTDPRVLEITKGEPVPFVKGYPDFSKWSQGRLRVDKMDGTRNDFYKIHKELANQKGFSHPEDARRWLTEKDLTPHHLPDGKTIDLVPRKLHSVLAHDGGAKLLRSGEVP